MGQVVTFYSYKGGVGRSFLLANVAALLSQWGHRVLCVDWDLEAPGLQHYFADWLDGRPRPGIVDLVLDASQTGSGFSWGRMLAPVAIPDGLGQLHLICAGDGTRDYFRKVQSIVWKSTYDGGFGRTLETIRAEWKNSYDFVLVDSRTGVSDIAGVCTVHLPDTLVYVFTANSQSIEGAQTAVQNIVSSREKLPVDREQLLRLPVLSRFAQDKEYDLAARWMDAACKASAEAFGPWLSQSVEVDSMMRATRIPEVAYWTFGERLPVVIESTAASDPQSINYPIGNVAALIAKGLGNSDQLLLNRESYIASAFNATRTARRIGLASDRIPVFISASADPLAAAFRTSLEKRAEILGLAVVDGQSPEATLSPQTRLKSLTFARFLIVLLGDTLTAAQSTEIEGFFSVSFRSGVSGTIVPVMLSRAASTNLPPLLHSFQSVNGIDRAEEAVMEDIIKLVNSVEYRKAMQ